jgi:hypothetical protein
VPSIKSAAEVIGFAQVKQSFGAMANHVNARTSRKLLKLAIDFEALVKGSKGKAIEDLLSLLLGGGHEYALLMRLNRQCFDGKYKRIPVKIIEFSVEGADCQF